MVGIEKDIFVVIRCYTAQMGSELPTCRGNLLFHFSKIKHSETDRNLEDGRDS